MLKQWWVALLLALLVVGTFVIPAQGASTNCTGTAGVTNAHDGAIVPPVQTSYMDRAKADITLQSASVCTHDNTERNFVDTYSMIFRSDFTGWAQIGFNEDPANGYDYFWQYHKCDTCSTPTLLYGSATAGTQKTFTVVRVAASGAEQCGNGVDHCLAMKRDGNSQTWTGFDPHEAWSHAYAEFSGETYYPGTDMAGVSGSKAHFNNISEDDNGNVTESWQGNLLRDCSAYYQWANPNANNVYTDFNIWTDPTNHDPNCGS